MIVMNTEVGKFMVYDTCAADTCVRARARACACACLSFISPGIDTR